MRSDRYGRLEDPRQSHSRYLLMYCVCWLSRSGIRRPAKLGEKTKTPKPLTTGGLTHAALLFEISNLGLINFSGKTRDRADA